VLGQVAAPVCDVAAGDQAVGFAAPEGGFQTVNGRVAV
jgi:hypothetical protein